jgi:hypothetical protein
MQWGLSSLSSKSLARRERNVIINDYVDSFCAVSLKMYRNRIKTYRKMAYEIVEPANMFGGKSIRQEFCRDFIFQMKSYGWKNGAGGASILAYCVLSVSAFYEVAWKRKVDYAELASKRWIEKLSIKTIAAQTGMGRTAVVKYIGDIRRNPSLIKEGRLRAIVSRRKKQIIGKN